MEKRGFEKLEQDIISTKNNLLEGRSSLTTVLTQTRIFCKALRIEHEWVTYELEGYPYKNVKMALDNLPKYRIVNCEFFDDMNRPIIFDNTGNSKIMNNLYNTPLQTSITNFQGLDNGGVIIFRGGDGGPVDLFQEFLKQGWLVASNGINSTVGITARISNNQLLVIYDKVKNRTIEKLSELEEDANWQN